MAHQNSIFIAVVGWFVCNPIGYRLQCFNGTRYKASVTTFPAFVINTVVVGLPSSSSFVESASQISLTEPTLVKETVVVKPVIYAVQVRDSETVVSILVC